MAFLHPDDKLKMDIDKIDQLIWAEIPIDYDSKELEDYLKEYRSADNHRTHRWKQGNSDSDLNENSDSSIVNHSLFLDGVFFLRKWRKLIYQEVVWENL